MREYEFVLAANSSNPEQDSSGDNQMQIRIPLSVTADWKVTGKSEPAILEYNITEPRYVFLRKKLQNLEWPWSWSFHASNHRDLTNKIMVVFL